MMKKTITVFLSMFMVLSLAACGNSADRAGQSSVEKSPAEESENNDADSAESVTNDGMDLENNDEDDVDNTEISETQQGVSEDSEAQGAKVLVAYFSATNTTEGVAEHIANGLHADMYEIVPEDPYTDADLNYNDNNSRTTIEMNDPMYRFVLPVAVA